MSAGDRVRPQEPARPRAMPAAASDKEAARQRLAIRRALAERGMTQKELAAQAEMSEQVLSHFLCQRRKRLKREELVALARVLGLSSTALTEADSTLVAASGAALLLPPRRLRLVPVYPIGAGYGISFGDGDMPVGESLDDPVFTDVPDPNAFAGRIVGSSMDPGRPGERGFREGDVVIFDTKAEVRSGAFCLVRFEDGTTTFKQVFFKGDALRLHALNPEISDEHRPRSAVRGIYRAVRHLQRI